MSCVRPLGFDAPLQSLRYWVVGASDPMTSLAGTGLDALQSATEHLEQDGWQVRLRRLLAGERRAEPAYLVAARSDGHSRSTATQGRNPRLAAVQYFG